MKLQHYDNFGDARFITIVCHRYLRLLESDTAAKVFLQCLKYWRDRYNLALLGYVVTPDHVHLVVLPREQMKLGAVVGLLKVRSAKTIIQSMGSRLPLDQMVARRNGQDRRVFWLRRCYDYNCRTRESVLTKIHYCHTNPVRRGLVPTPQAWPYSSAGDWVDDSGAIVTVDRDLF